MLPHDIFIPTTYDEILKMNRQTDVEKPQGEHDEQIQHFELDELPFGAKMRNVAHRYSKMADVLATCFDLSAQSI